MSKLSDCAKELVDIDNLVKELSSKLDDAKSKREEITEIFIKEMQENDLTEVSVDGLGKKFIVRKDTYANYLIENRDNVFEALREMGLGDIIKEEVNNKTFNSTIRTILDENDGVLPDCLSEYVNLFEKSKVGILKKG